MSSVFPYCYSTAGFDLVWPCQNFDGPSVKVHLSNVWMREFFTGLSVDGDGYLAYYFYFFAFIVYKPPAYEVPGRSR